MANTYDMTPFVSAFGNQARKQQQQKEPASLDDTLKSRGLATPSQIRDLAKQYVGNLINAGAMTEADAASKTREFEKKYMEQYGPAYKQVFDAYGIADYNAINNFTNMNGNGGEEEGVAKKTKAHPAFNASEWAKTTPSIALGTALMLGVPRATAYIKNALPAAGTYIKNAFPKVLPAAGAIGKAGLRNFGIPGLIGSIAIPPLYSAYSNMLKGPVKQRQGLVQPPQDASEEEWRNYYENLYQGQ